MPKCFDLLTNSLDYFLRKCVEISRIFMWISEISASRIKAANNRKIKMLILK